VIVSMVSRNVSRRWLLAGTSLIALSLASAPALAQCYPAPPAVVGTTGVCLSWSSGDLTVTNSGAISSADTGINISGVNPTGTLSNSGSISGSSYGIFNSGGTAGTLTNEPGGTISGGAYGIYNGGTTSNPTSGTIATLTNRGTISGTVDGIHSTGTIDVLTNESGGTISGGATAGINNNNGGAGGGTIGTLTNSGTISGGFYGIYSQGSIDTLTNESDGTISSGGSGINNSGTIGTLTNRGAISGGGYGIANTAAGVITTLTNESGGTISSASWSGIFNNGTIGTLTNRGAITGTNGIFNNGGGTTSNPNGGSIGTLTNSGTIGGNTYGINNTGMIGALTNIGTITGPIAIYNSSTGTIGPIVNSGLIAGNIQNDAAQALTINGGSGAIYGTLTGSSGSIGSGDKGTITNTNSNLIFDTGNILLNDDINVTGHSVTVTDATIVVVNPVTITGDLTVAGTIALGNSSGSVTVNGNYTQTGVYAVQVNNAGQSGKMVVNGTATLTGGTVSVQAQNGTYQRNTAYTILTAGNVSGTYSGVTSNLAFLTPSLAYSSGAVTLTLLSTANSFRSGAQTPNQGAVGMVLDNANSTATGDFNTVLNALSSLDTVQGPKALDTISGQPIANFGTANTQTANAFMWAVGAQMGALHGGSGGTTHVAMAAPSSDQACTFACDVMQPSRYGAWISGGGGLGSALGNSNTGALTYNFGGTAVGMDYAVTPDFRAGIGAGYITGTQWTKGFNGRGTTDAFSGSLYASYTPDKLYIDGLIGYAYAINRVTRTITIPGLQPRTATGTTDANQFMGQIETGYRLDLPVPATASITPFFRLAGSTTSQNGFSESGAQSLDLTVAPQTTNSLRTTVGADFAAEIRNVAVDFRLGWQHENADTARPMTASFAGAPGQAFTVYGATPQRDSAVLGLAAIADVADATELYARYDGEVGGGSDSHAFTAGLRMTW
jgi:uncharacterized protein with beta-barrel porin domain